MSRLPEVDPATATGEAAAVLHQVQASFGAIPNMAKVMATSPALLRAYLAMAEALAGGVLSAGVRERLAITAAETNECGYCLSAHTYIGANIVGVDAEELESARSGASADPHIGAILDLSRALLAQHGKVDDETWERARSLGVTDAEVGEVVGHVAINVLTNYFNLLTRVENEWPVVSTRVDAA